MEKNRAYNLDAQLTATYEILDMLSGYVKFEKVKEKLYEHIASGYDINENGYSLLTYVAGRGEMNPFDKYRLIDEVISMPQFQYKKEYDLWLVGTLAKSAYWLDMELFDESVLNKKTDSPNLTPSQRVHILMLDVGSKLIDKGFTFNVSFPKEEQQTPMTAWANTFLKQCQMRNAFLKTKSHHKSTHVNSEENQHSY